MHVITHARILEATQKWPQAGTALDGWYRLMKANHPKDFAEMKRLFPAVDKVGKFHVFDSADCCGDVSGKTRLYSPCLVSP